MHFRLLILEFTDSERLASTDRSGRLAAIVPKASAPAGRLHYMGLFPAAIQLLAADLTRLRHPLTSGQ